MKKKLLIGTIVMTMAFGLALTGCSGNNQNGTGGNNDGNLIVGNDWRTTGPYISGTLNHDSEIAVLADVAEDKMIIYYDEAVQKAYAKLTFPYETTSIQMTSQSINYEDVNEDGYTDITVKLYDQQGEYVEASFIWNADAAGFDCIAESLEGSGDFSLTNFIGSWLNTQEGMAIVIDNAYNWQSCDKNTVYVTGTLEPVYGVVNLYTSEGVFYCTLTYNGSALLDEYGAMYTYDGPVQEYVPSGEIQVD